jgi:HEAT repeat protein
MFDKKVWKVQGLRYARSLQTLIKTVNMFSVDHKSTDNLLQRSYEMLNPLVKQARLLTLGFVDQRFLLNNLLTREDSLKGLENELLKRGIGAVTFEAGITLAAYKNALATIAASPKLIDECGGLLPFLMQRPLEFVRIFPAVKNETRNEDGDTVLEMGSEEYLISKALSNLNTGFPQGIEAILSHMEVSGGGSGEGTGGGGGVGFGGGGSGFAGGSGPGPASGSGVGPGGTGSGSVGAGVGYGAGTGAGSGTGGGNGTGSGRSHIAGSFMEIQRMVEQKFEASLANPDEDPEKAFVELGRMLSNVRPDLVLSHMVMDKAEKLKSAPKEDVTAEVFEDTALRWALRRLSAIPAGADALIVEEQVFRVLVRSLQATHAASRLAEKLAEFAKEYALPKHIYEKIQAEIKWLSLTPGQKLRELLGLSHFSAMEFRRMLDLIKDLIRHGQSEDAIALGIQYFSIFQDHLALQTEEVGRVPELLRALSGVPGEFWESAADWLIDTLLCRKVNQLIHVQVVNALVVLARIAVTYEDFLLVQKVGMALEKQNPEDLWAHSNCCSKALSAVILPAGVDRIAEMFLEKKNDAAWVKLVAAVLRWADEAAIERIFLKLECELHAANRIALIRLISRVGPKALHAARQRLQHQEWYVVRNVCKVLGELKDPELAQHISGALTHKDERVQKAALQALVESRARGAAVVIANALPVLSPALREDALSELIFKADPECLPGLEKCFTAPAFAGGKILGQLINVIAVVQDDAATDLLVKISVEHRDEWLRKAAEQALSARTAREKLRVMPRNRAQEQRDVEHAPYAGEAVGYAGA